MDLTALTAVSAAALALALVAAGVLTVQSRRLHRLRDEVGARGRDLERMRSELDSVRRRSRPADAAGTASPEVPRPRAATSPTAWRRARAGGPVRTRRTLTR